MKAVILAGGRGTRLSEETQLKPKPLVEANGKPLIWHIMQNFSRHGVSEFIILSGYKGQQIREYFANFWLHQADLTFDLATPNQEIHKVRGLPWKVTVLIQAEGLHVLKVFLMRIFYSLMGTEFLMLIYKN